MNKKFIKQLVIAKYIDKGWDEKKVEEIAKYLNRKELKEFISELSDQKNKSTVFVDTAKPIDNQESYRERLQQLFPNKKIEFRVDPTLILGMRITDNDNVYQMNLRDSLQRIQKHLHEEV